MDPEKVERKQLEVVGAEPEASVEAGLGEIAGFRQAIRQEVGAGMLHDAVKGVDAEIFKSASAAEREALLGALRAHKWRGDDAMGIIDLVKGMTKKWQDRERELEHSPEERKVQDRAAFEAADQALEEAQNRLLGIIGRARESLSESTPAGQKFLSALEAAEGFLHKLKTQKSITKGAKFPDTDLAALQNFTEEIFRNMDEWQNEMESAQKELPDYTAQVKRHLESSGKFLNRDEGKQLREKFGVEFLTNNKVESAYNDEVGRVAGLLLELFQYRKASQERSFRGSFENL